jgi:hypothetical protein
LLVPIKTIIFKSRLVGAAGQKGSPGPGWIAPGLIGDRGGLVD